MIQRDGVVSKLRPSRVSAEYGIPEQTLANWRSVGRGPDFIRLSARHILYDRADLEKFFSDHKVEPGKAG
jgi:hypothetical protein